MILATTPFFFLLLLLLPSEKSRGEEKAFGLREYILYIYICKSYYLLGSSYTILRRI